MAVSKSATLASVEPIAAVPVGLDNTVLFNGVPKALVNQFIQRCGTAYFRKGDVLLSPIENNEHMYLLLKGHVNVQLQDLNSEPLLRLGPGECVGEISLFDGNNPSAYVIAEEPVSALVINSELLWDMVNQSHEVSKNLLYLLSKRIRSGNDAVNVSQALQRKTQEAANNDALTGIHNRRWLETLLVRLKGRKLEDIAPLSVIMLDVDHFKKFNDDHGHQIGDEVLKMVAKSTQSSLRPNDMVARYGGEEFVIVLPHTNLKHGKMVAERLRESVENAYLETGKGSINVTVSLGISEWQPGVNLETLIQHADEALYRAKDAGRNNVSE